MRAIGQSADGAGCPLFLGSVASGNFRATQFALFLATAARCHPEDRAVCDPKDLYPGMGPLAVSRRHSRECSASVPQEFLDLVEFLVRQIKILLRVGGVISLQGGIAFRQIQLHTLLC